MKPKTVYNWPLKLQTLPVLPQKKMAIWVVENIFTTPPDEFLVMLQV
jgi:hypothetical protein